MNKKKIKIKTKRTLIKMILKPLINNPKLTKEIFVRDENNKKLKVHSIVERPLTLYLNEQEIVTMMTICDYPKYLAIGYLLNQNMLKKNDKITGIDYDEEINTVVVRTKLKTNYEEKLKKKTLTSGCAQGTIFGDIMEEFEKIKLSKTAKIKASWLIKLLKEINTTPSLYLKARAIHGCVLCKKDKVQVYMEDVGRHNALDKLIGYAHKKKLIDNRSQFIACSGRLNFELVQKGLMSNIGVMAGVGAPTSLSIDLAKRFEMTLLGFVKNNSFNIYTKKERIIL